MATDSQSLYDQAKCYACYGLTEFEALELALLAQIVNTITPGTGSHLVTEGGDNIAAETGDLIVIE